MSRLSKMRPLSLTSFVEQFEQHGDVIFLHSIDPQEAWLKLLREGRADQIFIDSRGMTSQQLITGARYLYELVAPIDGLIQPIIFGWVTKLDPEVQTVFDWFAIRSTSHSFEQYCNSVDSHVQTPEERRRGRERMNARTSASKRALGGWIFLIALAIGLIGGLFLMLFGRIF